MLAGGRALPHLWQQAQRRGQWLLQDLYPQSSSVGLVVPDWEYNTEVGHNVVCVWGGICVLCACVRVFVCVCTCVLCVYVVGMYVRVRGSTAVGLWGCKCYGIVGGARCLLYSARVILQAKGVGVSISLCSSVGSTELEGRCR